MKKLKKITFTEEELKSIPEDILPNIKSNVDRLAAVVIDKLSDNTLDKYLSAEDTTTEEYIFWMGICNKVVTDIMDIFKDKEMKKDIPDDEDRLKEALTFAGMSTLIRYKADAKSIFNRAYMDRLLAVHEIFESLESRTGLFIPSIPSIE